ncbi:MAG: hypothetical protein ACD_17C00531G0002, partial [uncultured bacterium]
ESKKSTWDLRASRVHVVKNDFFHAQQVRLRLFGLPTLWLPSFKVHLKKFKEPIFRYYVNWNKGPLVGFRYQLYSWKDLALYGRLEYRWKKGWGGAVESKYCPENTLTTFMTRNYIGTNRLFNAEDAAFRYRIQGALHSESKSAKTHTTLTWDKYSDVRMPGDFHSEDFELNTALKTILYIHHMEENFITSLKVQPRANPFESMKQELPTGFLHVHPTEIKKTGILSTGFLRASYLDFDYSDELTSSLADFQSPRIEAYEKLFRPLRFKGMTVTPYISARAIFYGTSPTHQPKWLGVLGYGAKAQMLGIKEYDTYKHLIEPYLEYEALARPTVGPDAHYIFSIQDGYQKIQQIEAGVRHLFFSQKQPCKEPNFTASFYANAFFHDPVLPQMIPKIYLLLAWKLPSLDLFLQNCYNVHNQVWDVSNSHLKWTVNENIALNLEARYRSKYDWRKSDHENFILDVTRPENELLDSPLSDRRITLLSNLFIRLNPFWELKFESHHGFYRLYKNHIVGQSYNEFQIHLYTYFSSAWKLHFYYGYTLHNHFDWGLNIQMVKKTF